MSSISSSGYGIGGNSTLNNPHNNKHAALPVFLSVLTVGFFVPVNEGAGRVLGLYDRFLVKPDPLPGCTSELHPSASVWGKFQGNQKSLN